MENKDDDKFNDIEILVNNKNSICIVSKKIISIICLALILAICIGSTLFLLSMYNVIGMDTQDAIILSQLGTIVVSASWFAYTIYKINVFQDGLYKADQAIKKDMKEQEKAKEVDDKANKENLEMAKQKSVDYTAKSFENNQNAEEEYKKIYDQLRLYVDLKFLYDYKAAEDYLNDQLVLLNAEAKRKQNPDYENTPEASATRRLLYEYESCVRDGLREYECLVEFGMLDDFSCFHVLDSNWIKQNGSMSKKVSSGSNLFPDDMYFGSLAVIKINEGSQKIKYGALSNGFLFVYKSKLYFKYHGSTYYCTTLAKKEDGDRWPLGVATYKSAIVDKQVDISENITDNTDVYPCTDMLLLARLMMNRYIKENEKK